MPDSLHLLLYIFIGILVVVLLLIIAVLLYSFHQYKELRHRALWSEIIDKKVSEAIVFGQNDHKSDLSFDKFSENASFRDFFLEKLVSSENKFSGLAQGEIKGLFSSYNLKKEAFKKLDQRKPYLIAGGIQELTAMNVEEALPKISSYINHPSPQVFQEARYAMAAFRGFKGLEFLNDITNRISDWQQLRLLLSVSRIPEGSEHIISNWLASSNSSVVIFTLSLLRKFQMLSHYTKVWSLLTHHDDEVRVKAVHTLQWLENPSTIKDFMEIFPAQSLAVREEILKAMRRSRDPQCVPFLKQQLLASGETSIQIEAAETIFELGYETYLKNLADTESSSEHLVRIIKHALQEKIC
ncbi:HEAT repeat domain-containing protein [Chryseobacterium sp.]|uniref:HEAT repeat domain-containing protein n=1 Tax=Chryseobacterium sp. TaxID=1871047 RepID=UPI0011C79F17|nr:HEAT repeat domain-containing protein [Chryseobacterium sp.]TXF79206.1 HEAT repeat domain-containing protein [Chryseobacterium sp.]